MWYTLTLEQVIKKLHVDPERGLTQSDAEKILAETGKNILPRGKKTGWIQFLLRQFKSPLVYILLLGAVLTVWMGAWVDTTVILLSVAVNVAVGFWQEFRSNGILEKLNAVVETKAFVFRDGGIHEIDATLVVPGDVVYLRSGMRVPADARVFLADNLEVDEALLTGESSPVRKSVKNIRKERTVGDRENMIHMGTVVSRGEGRAVVVGTGGQTEIGEIARLTQETEDDPTPLQIRMDRLGKIIAILVGIIAVIIFVVGLIQERSFHEMFTTAIAVAVAAIPEGLPAAISIILAVSAKKILRRKGVIKQLVAAETLGSASVICVDKTGTLTLGKMTVESFLVEGTLEHARVILALANEAILEEKDGETLVKGETTDQAKMEAFLKEGGKLDEVLENLPRLDFLPFDENIKYIASYHVNPEGEHKVFFTGAPETLLDLSHYVLGENGVYAIDAEKKRQLVEENESHARTGSRMIAMAELTLSSETKIGTVQLEDETWRKKNIKDIVFVGHVALEDPIRDDVFDSMLDARSAGVRPIMLTGDHLLTAQSIGERLGFSVAESAVMEGSEIDALDDDEFSERIKSVSIFARVSPAHKLRIVDILQKQGEVVAMTGDGVNDAPALKSADIGIAVNSGTDIAKSASDLILLNNSFSVIVSAVRQGRIAFDNIRKVSVFLLTGSFTELILVMASLLLNIPLPITAVMILWTNLVEDSLPNVALSFEPGEKGIMKRRPIRKSEPVLDKEAKVIIFAVGIFTSLALLSVYLFLYYQSSWSLEHIQTLIFAALGLDTFFYIYSVKSLREPIFAYNIFSNKYLVLATIIGAGLMVSAVYVPLLNTLLGTVPLPALDWLIVLAIGVLNIVGVELVKWWFVHRENSMLNKDNSTS